MINYTVSFFLFGWQQTYEYTIVNNAKKKKLVIFAYIKVQDMAKIAYLTVKGLLTIMVVHQKHFNYTKLVVSSYKFIINLLLVVTLLFGFLLRRGYYISLCKIYGLSSSPSNPDFVMH